MLKYPSTSSPAVWEQNINIEVNRDDAAGLTVKRKETLLLVRLTPADGTSRPAVASWNKIQ